MITESIFSTVEFLKFSVSSRFSLYTLCVSGIYPCLLGFLNHACILSLFSRVQLCAILWTAACQAPLSMGFARQESWRGFPGLTLGDLPNPGTEPTSLTSTCTGRLGSSVHGIFQARLWSGFPFLSPGDLPNPGLRYHWQIFSTEPPRKTTHDMLTAETYMGVL